MPCLGQILALTLVYAIGEMARFQHARACSSYGRLVHGGHCPGVRGLHVGHRQRGAGNTLRP
jgi:hypothetical protein